MATNQSNRIEQIVKVAEVRKQRAANAAADARRKLATAEEERNKAAEQVQDAKAILQNANRFLLQSPATDQMLVWRTHCEVRKDESIAAQVESEECCAEAEGHLSQSLIVMHRQDLRHDHLSDQAKQMRQKLVRAQEARVDDEAQGCGQRTVTPILAGSISR